MVEACPECDSSRINRRDTLDPEWRCVGCEHEFDEPISRPRKGPGAGVGSSLGRALRDADPETIVNRRKA